jgi:broad specificity phosphatase PhoE
LGPVYLIRHGQAGSRDNYDVLSDVGREQAKRLGRHLAANEPPFSAILAGGMNRQRLTAEIACQAIVEAGATPPPLVTDARWNEFSLASVYRALAPRMAQEDSEFARDLEEMKEALQVDPHVTRGAAGRCDAAVFRAWIQNRYPDYDGESWISFSSRILECASEFCRLTEAGAVAVFTSATPITILTAAALGLPDQNLLRIAGALYNSSVTILRPSEDGNRLLTFNSVQHLPSEQRTFR